MLSEVDEFSNVCGVGLLLAGGDDNDGCCDAGLLGAG